MFWTHDRTLGFYITLSSCFLMRRMATFTAKRFYGRTTLHINTCVILSCERCTLHCVGEHQSISSRKLWYPRRRGNATIPCCIVPSMLGLIDTITNTAVGRYTVCFLVGIVVSDEMRFTCKSHRSLSCSQPFTI